MVMAMRRHRRISYLPKCITKLSLGFSCQCYGFYLSLTGSRTKYSISGHCVLEFLTRALLLHDQSPYLNLDGIKYRQRLIHSQAVKANIMFLLYSPVDSQTTYYYYLTANAFFSFATSSYQPLSISELHCLLIAAWPMPPKTFRYL